MTAQTKTDVIHATDIQQMNTLTLAPSEARFMAKRWTDFPQFRSFTYKRLGCTGTILVQITGSLSQFQLNEDGSVSVYNPPRPRVEPKAKPAVADTRRPLACIRGKCLYVEDVKPVTAEPIAPTPEQVPVVEEKPTAAKKPRKSRKTKTAD